MIFKMTIPDPERCLPFIAFTNPHPIIGDGEIQLDESLCPAKSIERFSDEG